MKDLHQILQENAIKFDKLELLFQSPAIEIYGILVHRLQAVVWNNERSYQHAEVAQEEEVHVAIFKKWEHEYGAEILTIFGSFLEFIVTRPPQDRDTALKLAHEHFVYCADIVSQGAGTLDRLAESLINSNRWVFWWD